LIFLILISFATPIGIALLICGLLFLVISGNVDTIIAAQRVATGLDSFPLLAIPFYMLAGSLMNTTGITTRIFNLARVIVGHIPGGLGHVNVLASMIFAGMSGSAVADAAGLGVIEIKAMTEDGYDKEFSAAITAASSTIGPIIPPSISMVIYGLVAGVSIGGLFLAGFIPGFLMGIFLMLAVYIISKKRKFKVRERASLKEFIKVLKESILALVTPILIVGGILGGIFTPTEAGAFAVLYTLFIGFIYKEIKISKLYKVILDTAISSGNTLFIIAVTSFIGWILTMEQVPILIAEWIMKLSLNKNLFLLFLNLVLLILGCFMASQPIIIMLTPIILPTTKILGIDPIHLGVVMVLNLMIGLLTPPVGLVLYIVSDIANISIQKLLKSLLPFLIALLAVLFLITFIPEIVLFLPKYFGYI
jgi:tripartite ATP-independent transporter DctM subunit